MSTLASLISLLGEPNIKPYNEQELTENRIRFGNTQNQTQLLELAELKRQQEAQAQARAYYQQHPEAALGQGGGPVLGSLAPTGGGPMTQQTTIPGQPPGAPQVVPGGQDLSRFATQGGPPQSTLASLAPPPQVNPLEQLMRQNPDAAFQVIGQQQKMLTTQLTMREKTAEAFASRLQGVNSQASYEAAVQDLMQWAPQQAARLPKVWSREAMEPIIASALAAKDKASLDIAAMKEATDFRVQRFKEQQAAAGVPKYTEDSTLNVAIDRRMQQAGIPRGTPPTEAILTQAQKDVEEGKVRVSAAQGSGQIVQTPAGAARIGKDNQVEYLKGPQGEPIYPKPTEAEQRAASFGELARKGHEGTVALENKGFTPGFWDKAGEKLPFGMGNYLASEDYQKYRQYTMDFAQAWLRKTSQGAVTEQEWAMVERLYFPQPGDTKAVVEQKRKDREATIQSMEAEGKQTGRTGTQAPPTTQGASGGQTSPPTSQGPATFDRADFLKWRQSTGKSGNPTQADVEAYFQAKGLKRR